MPRMSRTGWARPSSPPSWPGATMSRRLRSSSSRSSSASAAAEHSQLPFAEQIEFFRGKLNLPTAAWTDIWQAQHDRAFVVAGAARDALLADLRAAVDSAIAEGTTIAQFRRDFDSIVAKHGWSHKGGRAWRTRVIYGTNLRTSYAAGRYRQMKEIADRRPYWRYRHSHASEHPREEHLAWDGLILPHDDPWWDTHYGPNGWGCKCYVEALSQRDLERLRKSGPDKAPDAEDAHGNRGRERARARAPSRCRRASIQAGPMRRDSPSPVTSEPPGKARAREGSG